MSRNWKYYALIAIVLLLGAGIAVSINLMPTWLFVAVFLLLLLAITIFTWKTEGAGKALGKFFKELFFGW